jgi:hypothetical protein
MDKRIASINIISSRSFTPSLSPRLLDLLAPPEPGDPDTLPLRTPRPPAAAAMNCWNASCVISVVIGPVSVPGTDVLDDVYPTGINLSPT